MKKLIAFLAIAGSLVVFADALTLETLTVDKPQMSVCGVSLGMDKAQVKAELGKRKLNYTFFQKVDAETVTMVPDEDTFAVNARGDKIRYYISFRDGKVWYLEINFDGSGEIAKSFAAKLWQPAKGTTIEVVNQTVQIATD